MRLPKFLMTMIFLTLLALVYTHLQVQILDFAYQGKARQMKLQKLKDDNDAVMYNICILKSASNLGMKLLADNSHLRFLDDANIVKIESNKKLEDGYLVSSKKEVKKASLFSGIFSLKSQAEAGSIK